MARSEEVRCRLGLGLSLVWSDVVIRQPTAVCVFGEAVIVMVIVAVLQWSDPAWLGVHVGDALGISASDDAVITTDS